MRIAYADPPYVGQAAKHYADHPDFGGEVDMEALCLRLRIGYDAFILHASAPSLRTVWGLVPDARMLVWVKTFAAYKKNVNPAYAWGPIFVWSERKRPVTPIMRDWFAHPVMLRKGLSGAKPPRLIRWLFSSIAAQPEDGLDDLFPGTGIVGETWQEWQTLSQDERDRIAWQSVRCEYREPS